MNVSMQARWLVLVLCVVVVAAVAPSAHGQRPATCSELATLVYSTPVGGVDVAGPATPCPVLEQIVYGSSGLAVADWQLRYGGEEPGVGAGFPADASLASRRTPSAVPGGLDWGDASIGAGIALGVVLIAGGAALGIARRLAVVGPR